jgi:pimeloyl-ACP methyl ester carboxylesterase
MTHPSNRRRYARHGVLLAVAVVAGSSVLVASGLGSVADAHLPVTRAAAHPARTSMHTVWNKGHRLAFYVTSGHQPAIVLDAGGGEDHTQWSQIVPVLARQTGDEIITYDRSGFGRSPAVSGPWTAQNAVSDLHAGLTQIGVTSEAILVSHSLAGEIAFRLVRKYPGLVAGAVLVDASLPEFYTSSEVARIVAANKPIIAKLKSLPLTASSRQLIALAYNYGPVHTAYHKLTWPTSIPVNVITSSKTPYTTSIDARAWREAAIKFASGAANRRLVVADSGHEIPHDRPGLVINQIEDMAAR